MSDSCVLPRFSASDAVRIGKDLYDLEGPVKALHGERDLNFRIDDERGRFVLKIANAEESRQMLDCQHRVFDRLAEAQVFEENARVLPSVNGLEIESVTDASGQAHDCRVLPFIEGRLWSDLETTSTGLLEQLGNRLGAIDQALDGYSHPGLERSLLWDMEKTGTRLGNYKALLESEQDLQLVEHFESAYLQHVAPNADRFRRRVIHNDANRGNVLVSGDGQRVISIIDFGDMIEGWLMLEPAVAATYAMHGQGDPLAKAAALAKGYHRSLALDELEIGVLFDLMGMRLCMSLCLCAYQQQLQPDNAYLSIDQQQTRSLLQQLQPIPREQAQQCLREACTQP